MQKRRSHHDKAVARAGKLARRIAGRKGSGGGHNTLAAGKMPMSNGNEQECCELADLIKSRFVRSVARSDSDGATLVT
jgi:hypothetical protein